MLAPEITPEARSEIATALAVLSRHHVSAFRASSGFNDVDWPEDQKGCWVIPVGSARDNSQAFRPFWIGKAEMI